MADTIIDSVEQLLNKDSSQIDEIDSTLLQIAFNVLPNGVGIYSSNGYLLFGNEVFKQVVLASNSKRLCNILDSPDIPQDLREHLKKINLAKLPCSLMLMELLFLLGFLVL